MATNAKKGALRRALCKILVIALLVALVPTFPALAASDGMIRVRLMRLGNRTALTFKTSGEYELNGASITGGSVINVELSGGALKLYVNGAQKASGSKITLARRSSGINGGLTFTDPNYGQLYCGDLTLSISGGYILPVLRIYVETYLYGVVGYEMSNSFPLEALKAQAVAARTYAMRNKSASGNYDLLDSSTSQVFRGYQFSNHDMAIQAVDETKGMCLTYGGDYASCFFTATNGGQTESPKNIWGGSFAYLTVKDDPYDFEAGYNVRSRDIPVYPTSSNVLDSRLEAALKAAAARTLAEKNLSTDADKITISKISEVVPHTPKYSAPSRTYTKMRFTMTLDCASATTGNKVSTTISVDLDTYGGVETLLGLSINSTNNELVSVVSTDVKHTISFSRYGHGVGLSQRGAQQMAKYYGRSYKEILDFYYTGTALEKFALEDSPGGSISVPEASEKPTKAPDADGYYTLSEGDSGEAVKRLQEALLALGYFKGTPLGNYKSLTVAAVKAYQAAQGMTADGIATPALQKRLFEADEETGGLYGTVNTGDSKLNVREGPGTNYDVAGMLSDGTRVLISASAGDWYKVSAGKLTGYASKRFIDVETPAVSATPTPTPTPAPTPTPTSADAEYAIVTLKAGGSRLNVRKGPGTGYAVSGTLSQNERVQVLSLDGGWAHITSGTLEGYVSVDYITFEKATVTPTATPQPDVTTTYATIVLNSASSKLNVRAGAGEEYAVVAKLPKGTRVQVLGASGEWYSILSGSTTGYARKEYVVMDAIADGGEGDSVTGHVIVSTGAGKLNVRQGPGTGYAVIAMVKNGDVLEKYASSGGWTRVSINGVDGYVSDSYIKTYEPNAPTATPEATLAPNATSATIKLGSAASTLNVRQGPGVDYDVEGKLKNGAQVTVYGASGEWSAIQAGSLIGYVMTSYLQFTSTAATPPPEAGAGSDASSMPPSTTAVVKMGDANAQLNVRKGPDKTYGVAGTLANGTIVTIVSTAGSWALIKSGDLSGYASLEFLTIGAQASLDSTFGNYATLAKGSGGAAVTGLQRALKAGGYMTGEADGDYGTLTEKAVKQFESAMRLTVTGIASPEVQYLLMELTGATGASTVRVDTSLNVRAKPSTDSDVVIVLGNGAAVTILAGGDTWSRIASGNVAGYVMSKYLGAAG